MEVQNSRVQLTPLQRQSKECNRSVQGYNNQIRKLSENIQEVEIGKELAKISVKYGYGKNNNTFLAEAMIDDIKKHWSHYGIEEIEFAFELWSLGKIGDRSTELYGGEFNCLILNRVLSAYEVYRRNELNDYLSDVRDAEFKREQKIKMDEAKNNLNKITDAEIRAEVEKFTSYDQIPKWLVDVVVNRKLIKITDEEKAVYLEKGKRLTELEMEREMEEIKSRKGSVILIRDEINKINITKIGRELLTISRLIIFDKL